MNQQKLKTRCEDGIELATILIENPDAKAVVQINGATATPKEYYLPFAKYLVENGFTVCLFDYRGVCESQPVGGLRGCEYEYLDWAQKDMPAVLDYLDGRYPELDKLIVGHSVGGQKFGFMPNHHKIKGLVTFGSSAGYWGNMPLGYRIQTHFFFEVFRPISHLIYGYTAAKKLKIMEDLPKNITNTWREWCSVPEYFFDPKYYERDAKQGFFKELFTPIQIYWTSDDTIARGKNVYDFWKHVESRGGVKIDCLEPKNLGVKEIGHFGFFRKKFKDTIWVLALNKLNEFLVMRDK
jgi:predicted alpha/beta hydrolase